MRPLTISERIQLYENEAKMFERLAKEARDDNSIRAFKEKANERWQRALELREGA